MINVVLRIIFKQHQICFRDVYEDEVIRAIAPEVIEFTPQARN